MTTQLDAADVVAAQALAHFRQLDTPARDRLFMHPPAPICGGDNRERLAVALGATLYIPGNRPNLAETIARRCDEGVMSMVIDLEDSVADDQLAVALNCAVDALDTLAGTVAAEMLLFIRVRTVSEVQAVAAALGAGAAVLTGFVIPKFTAANGAGVFAAVQEASATLGSHLYVMPVLESSVLAHRESRESELQALAALLAVHRNMVLAVRVGATDMCGLFGIRRDRDLTIYDVRVVADVIASIVNYLGRLDGTGFVITGPVWEYFADHERMFRPQLRETPFAQQDAVLFRKQLVSSDLDGLLREITLDHANGMHGKTVIHPSHVVPVHALSAVSAEEYQDATDILSEDTGGVMASGYGNKMNELRPHQGWARRVEMRASVFGVTNPGVTFVDLLTALAAR